MNDDEIVQELISFVEEKEKEFQAQKLTADSSKAKTNVINAIVKKVKACIK